MATSEIPIWLGDNAPSVIFEFPFDIAGSDVRLVMRFGGRVLTRSVFAGHMTLDAETNRVTWPYLPSDFAEVPVRSGVYELQRVVSGGEARTYAYGAITLRSIING